MSQFYCTHGPDNGPDPKSHTESGRARRRWIFIIKPTAALPRSVMVRMVLPRCTGPVVTWGLNLVVKHKLACGLLGCGAVLESFESLSVALKCPKANAAAVS